MAPPPPERGASGGPLVRPWALEREKLWADIVAQRLLAIYTPGRIGSIGRANIEAECDIAICGLIGRLDRDKLLDYATQRVEQLAAAKDSTDNPRLGSLSRNGAAGG